MLIAALPLVAAALSLSGGLWEVRRQVTPASASPPSGLLRICRAPASIAEDAPPPMLLGCSVTSVERGNGSIRRQYQCLHSRGTALASVVYTGEPITAWRLEERLNLSNGRPGPSSMTIEARRIGDCPAGMATGTMELPDGRRVRVPEGQ
jgi:hypothetical protein